MSGIVYLHDNFERGGQIHLMGALQPAAGPGTIRWGSPYMGNVGASMSGGQLRTLAISWLDPSQLAHSSAVLQGLDGVTGGGGISFDVIFQCTGASTGSIRVGSSSSWTQHSWSAPANGGEVRIGVTALVSGGMTVETTVDGLQSPPNGFRTWTAEEIGDMPIVLRSVNISDTTGMQDFMVTSPNFGRAIMPRWTNYQNSQEL